MMVRFVTVLVLAHPYYLAVHVFREHRLRSIAVSQDEESVIAVIGGIIDRLLETGPATADSDYITHYLLETLHYTNSAVELYDINRLEAVTERTIDYTKEIAQTFA